MNICFQKTKSRPVALVESEKTAIIASYHLPQFLWIASGGKNGCFNANSPSVLAGRSVVLFPDLGATDYWQSKISLMKSYGINVQLFDYLEAKATENERKEGYDIADYLLKVRPDEAILQQMIKRNPNLKTLIETFRFEAHHQRTTRHPSTKGFTTKETRIQTLNKGRGIETFYCSKLMSVYYISRPLTPQKPEEAAPDGLKLFTKSNSKWKRNIR